MDRLAQHSSSESVNDQTDVFAKKFTDLSQLSQTLLDLSATVTADSTVPLGRYASTVDELAKIMSEMGNFTQRSASVQSKC